MALDALPASVTALVLFTYPVIVALFAALAGVERLTWRSLLAALAAFAGCALTAGGFQLSAGLLGARCRLGARGGGRLRRLRRAEQPLRPRRVEARMLALHLVQVAALLCVLWHFWAPAFRCRATRAPG